MKGRAFPQQLALPFREDPLVGSGFTLTRPLRKHHGCAQLLRKLHYVRQFFPELDSRLIRVGLTGVASGMAIAGGHELWFNPARVSYHVIAHEFTHLLQGANGMPHGEKSCDVYALARHWTLNDTAPYYVRVPASLQDTCGKYTPTTAKLICDTAKRAVELRASGTRHYIALFERTLQESAARALPDQSPCLPF